MDAFNRYSLGFYCVPDRDLIFKDYIDFLIPQSYKLKGWVAGS